MRLQKWVAMEMDHSGAAGKVYEYDPNMLYKILK